MIRRSTLAVLSLAVLAAISLPVQLFLLNRSSDDNASIYDYHRYLTLLPYQNDDQRIPKDKALLKKFKAFYEAGPLSAPVPPTQISPYTLDDVISVLPTFHDVFGVVIYDPSTDTFMLHYSNNMRWIAGCHKLVTSFQALAHSLRTMFPERFKPDGNSPPAELALAISSGDYPGVGHNDCYVGLEPTPRHKRTISQQTARTTTSHILTTTMSTVPQSTSQDPPHHGINDGSGEACGSHSYALVDEEGKVVSRDESLTEILISKGVKEANFISAIVSLGEATAHIAVILQNYVDHSYAGTQNSSGDDQLHLDIDCDNAVFRAIRDAGVFSIAASEETPEEVDVSPKTAKEDGPLYSLGFDPLDGSSIIDANFSVGSIFGIWPGKGLLGRTGREQVASVVSLYGPRTTLIIALPSKSRDGDAQSDITFEVTLVKDRSHWEVSRPEVILKPAKKVFAPGNLRATNDNAKYDALVKHWISDRYTLRYSGGMVPDVYHMFAKSGGVFSNVSSDKAKAKLRLLYEVAAMGLLVECAGGVTTHEFEDKSVLDFAVDDLDRRMGVCFGSKDEVQKYKDFMFSK